MAFKDTAAVNHVGDWWNRQTGRLMELSEPSGAVQLMCDSEQLLNVYQQALSFAIIDTVKSAKHLPNIIPNRDGVEIMRVFSHLPTEEGLHLRN